jgi:hypothetical protein
MPKRVKLHLALAQASWSEFSGYRVSKLRRKFAFPMPWNSVGIEFANCKYAKYWSGWQWSSLEAVDDVAS